MLRLFANLKVARKLGLAAATFAVPVVYILWGLISEQGIAVRFAAREVIGAEFLAGMVPVQQEAATLALAGAAGAPQLATPLAALQQGEARALGLDAPAEAAVAALREPGGLAEARAGCVT